MKMIVAKNFGIMNVHIYASSKSLVVQRFFFFSERGMAVWFLSKVK